MTLNINNFNERDIDKSRFVLFYILKQQYWSHQLMNNKCHAI